jgi:hypothetical protein
MLQNFSIPKEDLANKTQIGTNIVVIKMDALIVKHVFFQILIIWFNSDTLLTIKSHLFFHLDWIGSPIPLTAHVWKYKNV